MSKPLAEELTEFQTTLALFRKQYAEDGTITADEQAHLDVLEGKIKRLLAPAGGSKAGNGNGQPFGVTTLPGEAKTTNGADVLGGGTTVRADSQLPPAPALSDKEKAQRDYEAKLGRLKADLDAVDKSKPTDAALVAIRAEILKARSNMEVFAKISKDYIAANEEIDKIPPLLAKYKKAASQPAAKKLYQEKIGGIKAEVKWALDHWSSDEDAVEIHNQLVSNSYEMEAAAAKGDYVTANQHMKAVTDLITKYRTAIGQASDKQDAAKQDAAKKNFEAKWNGVKEAILKVLGLKPEEEALQKIMGPMKTLDGQIKNQLRLGDFVEAVKQLDQLISLHAKYQKTEKEIAVKRHGQDQASAKVIFEGNLRGIKDDLAYIRGYTPVDPKLLTIHKQINAHYKQMGALVSLGDYVSANRNLDEIALLVIQYQSVEKAAQTESDKKRYEARWQTIREYVTDILGFSWDVEELKKLQAEVKVKKDAMEAAAAKGKWSEAVRHLDQLSKLADAFLRESRKTSKGCQWVRDTAGELAVTIDIKYTDAAAKLNAAALAYKTALQLHKEALESKKHDFARDFLVSLFFMGLGGAAGGAVGAVAQNFFKRITEVGRGAVVDATKDIVKFVTRSLQEAGKTEFKDPLAGRNPLSGDALDLALGMGAELLLQKALLLRTVKDLYMLVKENPKCIKNEDVIRFDVDPVKALDKDPFLEVLGKVVADVKTYSRLVWLHWADDIKNDSVIARHADALRDQVGTVESLEKRIQRTRSARSNAYREGRPGQFEIWVR